MRTPTDNYTSDGRLRIYSRNRLVKREHSHLHLTGEWYVEPVDWSRPEPKQRGYESFAEARVEADAIESILRVVGK